MSLEKIGPYNLLSVVGRGGMGSVYRAEHRDSGEIHAVKVLAPNFTEEDHFRNRFESEIQALIKLNHPNIVRILSYGQEMGNLFFAMELVEGKSLFQLQKKGYKFDWREILAIAKQIAKGLRHAHDRGIIHRDLKPGNLLQPINELGYKGEIKITDFGIAKRFGTSQNTGENVLGTMDFMSPEQAKGQPVTIRSDLYSLGTLLYSLLSGRPPFSGNSVEESLRNLTRVPAPNIGSVVPEVPRELDELLQKLMAKRPEERIATAQALLYKIEDIETQLLETAQAKTFEAAPRKDDETFDIATPAQIVTEVNTPASVKNKSAEHRASVAAPSASNPTVDSSADESDSATTSSGRKIDYFNTVTDHIRDQQSRGLIGEPSQRRRGFWPILLAFLAVVGLAVYGVYRVNLPPTAEQLFATIEASESKPQSIVAEMELFLQHYPDDSRADQVQTLYQIGSAIQFFNRLTNKLSIRSNVPGESRLTEIEKQFLEIAELAADDPKMAEAKMVALVTVHAGTDLSERDQQCLTAAKHFRTKIRSDARVAAIWRLQKIKSAMDAARLEPDPELARQKYQSIVELFADENWGTSEEDQAAQILLEEAKAELK